MCIEAVRSSTAFVSSRALQRPVHSIRHVPAIRGRELRLDGVPTKSNVSATRLASAESFAIAYIDTQFMGRRDA